MEVKNVIMFNGEFYIADSGRTDRVDRAKLFDSEEEIKEYVRSMYYPKNTTIEIKRVIRV